MKRIWLVVVAFLLGCGNSIPDQNTGGSGGEAGSGGSGGEAGSGGLGTVTLIQGCAPVVPSDVCDLSLEDMSQQCEEATLGAYAFPWLCVKDAVDKCVWIGVKGMNCSWATDAYLYCCPCQ